jgi:hypothetical protein
MLSTLNVVIFIKVHVSILLLHATYSNCLKVAVAGSWWPGWEPNTFPARQLVAVGLWAGLQAAHQTRSRLGQAQSCSSPNTGPCSPGGWLWLATAWSAGQAPYSVVSKHALEEHVLSTKIKIVLSS